MAKCVSSSCTLVCQRPACKFDEQYSTCLSPEFYRDARRLLGRLCALQPCPRISMLAQPKWVTPKFCPKPIPVSRRRIEFYRPDDRPSTRIEQLAYSPVRKLLPFKERVKELFGPKRHSILNRLIRKSMFSVYSRLANTQSPQKIQPTYKWTKEDWKKHKRHFTKLARAKKEIKLKPMVRECTALEEMKRFITLAQPKVREEMFAQKWELTKGMRRYKPSMRLLEIAKPKYYEENIHYQEVPWKISRNAKTYKISPRVKELATPHEKRFGENDLKENPFAIAPNALKARPSERTKELAQPKEYEETHIREDAFKISPNALKAKPSARIIELAKPKGS